MNPKPFDGVERIERSAKELGRRMRRVEALQALSLWAWLGFASALLLLVAARLTPIPSSAEIALIVALLWPLVLLIGPWIRHRPDALRDAIRADRRLGLADRLGSALAFARDADSAGALAPRQLADALACAQSLEPRRAIPWSFDRRRAGLAMGLAVAAALLAWLPNPQDSILARRAALQESSEQLAEDLEALAEREASRAELSPEEEALLREALGELAQALAESRGRAPEDLSQLAKAEAQLSALQEPLALSRAERAAAMQRQLRDLAGSATDGSTAAGEGGDQEGSEAGLEALASAAADSAAERAALAKTLQDLAEAEQVALPELAEALSDLARTLEDGDTAGAQAAAAAAGAAMDRVEAAAAGPLAAARTQAALQAAREALAEAEASGEAQRADLAAAADGRGAAPALAALASESSVESGASSGAPAEGASSGQGGSPSAAQGEGAAAPSTAGGESGQGGDASGPGFSRGGSGQGAEFEGSAQAGQPDLGGPAQPDDRQGASGLVYAPPERSGQTGQPSFIPGQASGLGSGPGRSRASRDPGGLSTALQPYAEVYPRYREAAGRALERESIPPELRDYLRLYFEALEP